MTSDNVPLAAQEGLWEGVTAVVRDAVGDDTGPAVCAVPVLLYPTVSLFLWFLSFTAGVYGGNDSTPQKP